MAPYLTLMPEEAGQREHPLREVFNGLRYIVRPARRGAGCRTTCRRGRRSTSRRSAGWRRAASRRMAARPAGGAAPGGGPRGRADGGGPGQPDAAVHAGERRSGRATTGPSARRAARCTSPWTPWATCWRCTSRRPTPRTAPRWPAGRGGAGGDGRERRGGLRRPGLHRRAGRPTPPAHGIRLEVVKLPEAKRGFVLLPRRWVVERSFAWATRFRRLARDYERLPRPSPACTSSPSPASCSSEPPNSPQSITASRCLIPRCGGTLDHHAARDALWPSSSRQRHHDRDGSSRHTASSREREGACSALRRQPDDRAEVAQAGDHRRREDEAEGGPLHRPHARRGGDRRRLTPGTRPCRWSLPLRAPARPGLDPGFRTSPAPA